MVSPRAWEGANGAGCVPGLDTGNSVRIGLASMLHAGLVTGLQRPQTLSPKPSPGIMAATAACPPSLPVPPGGVAGPFLHSWVPFHSQNSGSCLLPLASPPFSHPPIFCSFTIRRWVSTKWLSGAPEWRQAGP